MHVRKEEMKLALLAVDIIIYVENCTYKKLLELISLERFCILTGYRVTIQKSTIFYVLEKYN